MKSIKWDTKTHLLILLIIFSFFQINFAQANESTIPPSRTAHMMVYISQSNKIFLFGGAHDNSGNAYLNDSWIFDCTTEIWQEINVALAPKPTAHDSMTYDANNDRVILFTKGETWIFTMETSQWSKLNLTEHPSKRMDSGFAFDPKHSQALLFGGFRTDGKLGDLWRFDCNTDTWYQINQTGIRPSNRYGPSLVYSRNLERVYLIGGRPYGEFCDVWVLNPNNYSWQEITIEKKKPSKRYWMDAAMDQKNDKIVFYSGSGSYPNLEEITWTFNCKTEKWSEIKRINKPKMRMTHQMVYIEETNKMFLFGGGNPEDLSIPLGDQWYYNLNLNMWREVNEINLPFLLINVGLVGFIAIVAIVGKVIYIWKKNRKMEVSN